MDHQKDNSFRALERAAAAWTAQIVCPVPWHTATCTYPLASLPRILCLIVPLNESCGEMKAASSARKRENESLKPLACAFPYLGSTEVAEVARLN